MSFREYLSEGADELTDLADDFGAGRLIASARRRMIALPTIRPSATGASPGPTRTADPKADADRQIGLGPQPADVLDQVGGDAFAFAGDPCNRDVIDEARRRPGNLNRTIARRGGRDELNQLETPPAGLVDQRRGFLDRKVGTIKPSTPAVAASFKYRSTPRRWMIA